jgi:hypothetical protein
MDHWMALVEFRLWESDYEGVTVWIGDAADGDVGLDDDRRDPKPAAVPFEGVGRLM